VYSGLQSQETAQREIAIVDLIALGTLPKSKSPALAISSVRNSSGKMNSVLDMLKFVRENEQVAGNI